MKGKKQDLNSARGQKDTTAFPQMFSHGHSQMSPISSWQAGINIHHRTSTNILPWGELYHLQQVCIAHLLVVLITQQQYTMGLEASCSELSW